ncbi:SAM-dependent methyltransferase [Xanthomonas arboricola]|uniref:class I SAM-dependent methyltransferase n=1 Tax=Xanthomonas campestris TaxID=339 RepID=UPI0023E9968E|nr:SAM-dependent methyltransferase [Xanthomonas campestris]MCW2006546.1 SAM-dependent methyltransferase [Xanthomonas campestris]
MSLIADSDAVLDGGRILPQHQAALTLLNAKLQDPDVAELRWLDMACGRGQIIAQLLENITPQNRSKLVYVGFDIHVDHTRVAERLASKLSLKDYSFHQGDLTKFSGIVDSHTDFDFITFTNTAHEVSPSDFSRIMLEAILRLSPSGDLFIYDMESLTEPELGALPWNANEISVLFKAIFDILEPRFSVQPSTWRHKNCKGWTAVIQRRFVKSDNDMIKLRLDEITSTLKNVVGEILGRRLDECDKALDAYCRFGAETPNDEQEKLSCLYKFWALHQVIGAQK